ncbi:MAG: amidophosphoribosyltransferase, partial [Lachnospiraceae bacterium]|nr:amidophosphoribosyltransferase [Lachnospiraceae bacterium]
MGGFFGAVSRRDVVLDVFFGTDYHSHLGTRSGGMVLFDRNEGFNRQIHSIANSQFRTKFEKDLPEFRGFSGIGCISDSDPQPLMVRSHLGLFAISTVGRINNSAELVESHFSGRGQQFMAMSSGKINNTELVAALINEGGDTVEGIKNAQKLIDGSITIVIMTSDGHVIAARDRKGRLPVLLGQDADGMCVSFESFACQKLGYGIVHELGPGEIVSLTPDGYEILSPAEGDMKICAFLWTYYGYPNSTYE